MNIPQNHRQVSLIGVPTDIGASQRGASMGPDALRVAGISAALARWSGEVLDIGNLYGPANPQQPAQAGYRHLAQCAHWNQSVHDAVYAELLRGHLPIVLGGDHSVAIGSLSAVARHVHAQKRQLRVLWLDAHADTNTHDLTPSGNLHGMPVACLCGMGPQALTHMAGHFPAIAPADFRLIGQRSVDAGERSLIQTLGLTVYDMRTIDEWGMRHVMAEALRGLDDNTHLHVSLDVDFLDPEIAPGVATTVRGGPTYREAQLCMEMIADTGRLASLDLVELNPAWDQRNQTAELTVDLLESMMGKSTLLRTGVS